MMCPDKAQTQYTVPLLWSGEGACSWPKNTTRDKTSDMINATFVLASGRGDHTKYSHNTPAFPSGYWLSQQRKRSLYKMCFMLDFFFSIHLNIWIGCLQLHKVIFCFCLWPRLDLSTDSYARIRHILVNLIICSLANRGTWCVKTLCFYHYVFSLCFYHTAKCFSSFKFNYLQLN